MKKLLAFFLALMMLALPALSIAEEEEALSFIEQAVEAGRMAEWELSFELAGISGDESIDAIIADVLGALVLKGYHQSNGDANQGGFRVSLSNTDVLSIDAALNGDDIYLNSDLLAGTTIVATPEELQVIGEKFISALQAMGLIDEAQAQLLLESINNTELTEAVPGAIASADVEISAEDFDTTALEAFVAAIAEKATQADLAGQPEGSDPAIAAVTIPFTADDIVGIYEQLWAMFKGNAAAMASFDAITVTDENGQQASFEETIDKALETLKTQLPAMIEGEILVTAYYDGNDEPVAMVGSWTMKDPEENSDKTYDVDLLYTRLTEDDGVTYRFDMEAVNPADEADKIAASFAFVDQGDDGVVAIAIQVAEDVIGLVVTYNSEEGDTELTRDVICSLNVLSDGETTNLKVTIETKATTDGVDAQEQNLVRVFIEDEQLFALTFNEKTGEPVASIATDDAVRLAQLSDEDFQGWLINVINGLQTWLFTALQALPQSVVGLFF